MLYWFKEFTILVCIVSDVLVVNLESYLTVLVNNTDVVSGSTIIGLTEATL